MDVKKTIKNGVKLVSTGSVQTMIGGIVAAAMPANISLPFKAATYIGSIVIAGFVGDKIDEYVDHKMNDVDELVEAMKDVVDQTKEKMNELTKQEVEG